jgi:hypothetical protein
LGIQVHSCPETAKLGGAFRARSPTKDPEVEESQNPYAPPKADNTSAPPSDLRTGAKMFSARQAWGGTLLGGPLAGAYFIRVNFVARGERKRAAIATFLGVVITLAIVAVVPFMPERLPHSIIPIAYSMAAWSIVEQLQLSKAEAAKTPLHSNWRVVGVALLGFVLFLFLIGLEFLFLAGPET